MRILARSNDSFEIIFGINSELGKISLDGLFVHTSFETKMYESPSQEMKCLSD